jgi:Bacteriophage tail sheath protein
MPTYKTPDVYVEEIPVFPPSVAEVGTAIPAFIGYTQKARKKADDDLQLVPTKVYSLAEYEALFGGPHPEPIHITLATDTTSPTGFKVTYTVGSGGILPAYLLYWAVKMYFDNGGGQAYIVSVGDYADAIALGDDDDNLQGGLVKVGLEDEPTLLVIPEAVKLTFPNYQTLAQKMLAQCGALMDRFAIIDVFGGNKKVGDTIDAGNNQTPEVIVGNRGAWSTNLKYGAAYYPFLLTSYNHFVLPDNSNVKMTIPGGNQEVDLGTLETTETKMFNLAKAAVLDHFITLPPSGAVAGVYAAVDGSRGVWKSPANVALSSVLEPVVKIDTKLQEGLNVDAQSGKSINAIRAFAGKGTLVWGARTLAGNDNEWRYVSVRRFFNMVEESVKKSTYFAVFEPNDATLWVKVRGMIENYLIDKWRDGALAGALPKDAFYVKCGLGTTMSAQDILEGRLHVEIGMAVVRPAEFIVLKFFHKLQTS